MTTKTKYYPPLEEKLNILSHTVGIVLSVIALVLLSIRAIEYNDIWRIVSFPIFGACLVILYSASTCYHLSKQPHIRNRLRIVDHASIYLLIAGSYTPFTLVTLNGMIGWVIFGLAWGMAIIGITLKIFFTGRYQLISTLMYVFMGWMIVFFIKPLIKLLPEGGVFWLVAGGGAYTVGAILYAIKRLKFNHAIFHVMVLLGSFCHFMSIYYFV